LKHLKFLVPLLIVSFFVISKIDAQTKDNYFSYKLSNDLSYNKSINFTSVKDTASKINLADTPPKWHEFITNIPGDYANFLRVTFKSNKIPLYIGTGVLTGILIATDDWSWRQSDKWYKSSNFVKSASDVFVDFGDGKSQFGLGAAFAAYGFIAGDNKALRTGSQVVQAVLASGFVVQILKHITGRESPFVSTANGGVWRFFPNQITYHKKVPHYDAFPSGHLTTSIATVIVIAENYPSQKWIKPLGYLISTGIAVGMVNTGIHWYSDYPLAIILGYTFGMLASHPEGLTDILGSDEQNGFSVSPAILSNGMNLNLKYNF
jgi:hypothetical protein